MDPVGSVWLGSMNYLTHFYKQVCAASTVTVIEQTSSTYARMIFLNFNRALRISFKLTINKNFLIIDYMFHTFGRLSID